MAKRTPATEPTLKIRERECFKPLPNIQSQFSLYTIVIVTDKFGVKTLTSSQIEIWSQSIRAGEGHAVARQLQRLKKGQVSEDLLAGIGNLAWRLSLPHVGLRLIFPYIKRQHDLKGEPDPDVLVEFAGCLLEIGAHSESREILRKVESRSPRAKFYLALHGFKNWDYEGAAELLSHYLQTLSPSYHRHVIRVNLASALVVNRQFAEARALLAELREDLKKEGHLLLLGNSLEIASQIDYLEGRHAESLRTLAEAEHLLSGTRNAGWLFVKKWEFLNRIKQKGTHVHDCAGELEKLKKLAADMASWETIRDLDYHWGLFTRDSQLLAKVYFGSPVARYRQRLADAALAEGIDLSAIQEWVWSGSDGASPLHLESLQDLVVGGDSSLHAWLPKRLLLILTSDIYAPFRTGQLFAQIFTNEHYSPETSPDRVFQLVSRLKKILKTSGIGELKAERNGYQLLLKPAYGLRLDRDWIDQPRLDRLDAYRSVINGRFRDRAFGIRDLSESLGVSLRTANRIIKDLGSSLDKSGSGRATRYKVAA